MAKITKANELRVTSIEDLQAYARGAVVELPPFADGQPFVARLRRPSMLALVKSGKIPNELLQSANELFMGKPSGIKRDDKFDPSAMSRMFDVFDIMCEASFIEPTYQQLCDAGVELTDDQYTFIFNYSQAGIKALNSFRKE